MLSRNVDSFLCVASILLTTCLSENDANGSNYFIDHFLDGEMNVPYPVGQCVATHVTGSDYAIYSCSENETTVTKTTYSDATCETSTGDAVEYTSSDATNEGLYEFNCAGMDYYAITSLCVTPAQDSESGDFDCNSCSIKVDYLQATNVCLYGGPVVQTYLDVVCDSDSVDTTYYQPTDVCSTNITLDLNSAGNGCTLFTQLSTSGGTISVYWTYEGCIDASSPDLEPTTSEYSTSASTSTSTSDLATLDPEVSDLEPLSSEPASSGDDDSGSVEDLAVKLSTTRTVFALIMIVPLIKFLL